MAKGFQVSEHVACPPAEVWAYLSDLTKAPAWMKGVEAVEPLDAAPLGPGKRYGLTMSTVGRGRQREMWIADFEDGRRIAVASREGKVEAVYTYICEPDGDGTRVTLDAVCTPSGLVMRLLHPLIVIAMRRHDGGQLAALRAAMKATSAKV